ncbi:MAG: hypothetical protein JXR96_18070 [Deltaproteobacteria bacterium]|nr:hypothetical protein [Deltaproteobacteria bacterium]
MIKVISVRTLEYQPGCVLIQEHRLDRPVDMLILSFLASGADLQLLHDGSETHFQIEKPGAYVIQGVLGQDRYRISTVPVQQAETWQVA